jgi:hypothetical protein
VTGGPEPPETRPEIAGLGGDPPDRPAGRVKQTPAKNSAAKKSAAKKSAPKPPQRGRRPQTRAPRKAVAAGE